jgi:hypothetical protein
MLWNQRACLSYGGFDSRRLHQFQRRVPRRPVSWNRSSKSLNAARPSSMCIRILHRTLSPIPWDFPTICLISRPTPIARSLNCTSRQVRTHAKREVHLLSRRRLDSLSRRAFRHHRRNGLYSRRRPTRHRCRHVPSDLLGHGIGGKRSCVPHAA